MPSPFHQQPAAAALSAAAGGGGGGGYPPPQQSDVVSQQIATALIQLQQDMNSVLIRLNTLEALTVAQSQVCAVQCGLLTLFLL